eukprot:TRINITY_DN1188_c0_g2_i1.p1 TRINITY_DN1188_c0_g2~~TRINITY_DN1188_c0_g2_i1.p1  ORF type:complete len:2078 (-),score=535.23 TRINITY_DN1188_c0_g2_i1:2523-8756(-)
MPLRLFREIFWQWKCLLYEYYDLGSVPRVPEEDFDNFSSVREIIERIKVRIASDKSGEAGEESADEERKRSVLGKRISIVTSVLLRSAKGMAHSVFLSKELLNFVVESPFEKMQARPSFRRVRGSVGPGTTPFPSSGSSLGAASRENGAKDTKSSADTLGDESLLKPGTTSRPPSQTSGLENLMTTDGSLTLAKLVSMSHSSASAFTEYGRNIDFKYPMDAFPWLKSDPFAPPACLSTSESQDPITALHHSSRTTDLLNTDSKLSYLKAMDHRSIKVLGRSLPFSLFQVVCRFMKRFTDSAIDDMGPNGDSCSAEFPLAREWITLFWTFLCPTVPLDIQNAVIACLRVLSRLHLKDVLALSTQTLPILKKDEEMVQFAPFIRAIAYSEFRWEVPMNQHVIQEFLTQMCRTMPRVARGSLRRQICFLIQSLSRGVFSTLFRDEESSSAKPRDEAGVHSDDVILDRILPRSELFDALFEILSKWAKKHKHLPFVVDALGGLIGSADADFFSRNISAFGKMMIGLMKDKNTRSNAFESFMIFLASTKKENAESLEFPAFVKKCVPVLFPKGATFPQDIQSNLVQIVESLATLDAKSFIPEVVPLLDTKETSFPRAAILLDGLQRFGMKNCPEIMNHRPELEASVAEILSPSSASSIQDTRNALLLYPFLVQRKDPISCEKSVFVIGHYLLSSNETVRHSARESMFRLVKLHKPITLIAVMKLYVSLLSTIHPVEATKSNLREHLADFRVLVDACVECDSELKFEIDGEIVLQYRLRLEGALFFWLVEDDCPETLKEIALTCFVFSRKSFSQLESIKFGPLPLLANKLPKAAGTSVEWFSELASKRYLDMEISLMHLTSVLMSNWHNVTSIIGQENQDSTRISRCMRTLGACVRMPDQFADELAPLRKKVCTYTEEEIMGVLQSVSRLAVSQDAELRDTAFDLGNIVDPSLFPSLLQAIIDISYLPLQKSKKKKHEDDEILRNHSSYALHVLADVLDRMDAGLFESSTKLHQWLQRLFESWIHGSRGDSSVVGFNLFDNVFPDSVRILDTAFSFSQFHDVVPFSPLTSVDVRTKWLDYAALVFPLLDAQSAKRIVHLWNLSILQEPCTEQFLLHTTEFIRKSLKKFPTLADDVWHLVGNMIHYNPNMMEDFWKDMLTFVRKYVSPHNIPPADDLVYHVTLFRGISNELCESWTFWNEVHKFSPARAFVLAFILYGCEIAEIREVALEFIAGLSLDSSAKLFCGLSLFHSATTESYGYIRMAMVYANALSKEQPQLTPDVFKEILGILPDFGVVEQMRLLQCCAEWAKNLGACMKREIHLDSSAVSQFSPRIRSSGPLFSDIHGYKFVGDSPDRIISSLIEITRIMLPTRENHLLLEEAWQNLFSDFANLPQLACEIVFVLVRGTSRSSKANDVSMVATHIAAITFISHREPYGGILMELLSAHLRNYDIDLGSLLFDEVIERLKKKKYISHALKEDELSALVLFTAVLKEVPHYVGPFLPLLLLHVFVLCAPSVESRIRSVGNELLQVLLECLCGKSILKIVQPDIEKIMSNVPEVEETKKARASGLKDLGAPEVGMEEKQPTSDTRDLHQLRDPEEKDDEPRDKLKGSRVRMSTLCGWKREDIKSIVQSLAISRSKLQEDLKDLCYVWMVETRDPTVEWLSFRMHVSLFDHFSSRSVSRLSLVVLNVSERHQFTDKETGSLSEWKHLMTDEALQTMENVPDESLRDLPTFVRLSRLLMAFLFLDCSEDHTHRSVLLLRRLIDRESLSTISKEFFVKSFAPMMREERLLTSFQMLNVLMPSWMHPTIWRSTHVVLQKIVQLDLPKLTRSRLLAVKIVLCLHYFSVSSCQPGAQEMAVEFVINRGEDVSFLGKFEDCFLMELPSILGSNGGKDVERLWEKQCTNKQLRNFMSGFIQPFLRLFCNATSGVDFDWLSRFLMMIRDGPIEWLLPGIELIHELVIGRSKFLDAEMIVVILSLVDYLLVHADEYSPMLSPLSIPETGGLVKTYKLPEYAVNNLEEILSFIIANRETSSDESVSVGATVDFSTDELVELSDFSESSRQGKDKMEMFSLLLRKKVLGMD